MLNACRYLRDEEASGIRQPNAAMTTLEQEDTKVFFQRLDPRADAGLADTKEIRRMAKAEAFGDCDGLD